MAAKRRVGRELAETPLAVFVCPSRRTAAAHPFVHPVDFHNIDRPTVVARSDYAANAGDQAPNVERRNGARGPESLAEGDDPRYKWNELNRTGVVFRRSQIAAAHITDGLGFTYLVAEKYLQRSEYSSGTAQNDDQTLYVGYDSDTLRVTDSGFPPRRDSRVQSDQAFGSPHSNAFHAAFCDGSVHLLSYRLSLFTHQWLGNRRDGKHVDVLAP
jgi:prepilin-type processing-associated H-X9-DG protein